MARAAEDGEKRPGDSAWGRLLGEERRAGRAPREDELWAYALGVLELEEDERMLRRIAASEEAQARLAEIREAMASAAGQEELARRWAGARLVARVRASLEALGEDLSSVAGAVLETADGLIRVLLPWEDAVVKEREPVLSLGPREAAQPVAEEPPSPSIQLVAPGAGMKVGVVRPPGGGVDLHVEFTEGREQGTVGLYQVVQDERGRSELEDTGIQGAVTEGRARLSGCPEGILKVVGPSGRYCWVPIGLCSTAGRRRTD